MKASKFAVVTITLGLMLILPGCGSNPNKASDDFANSVVITSTPFSQSMNTTKATSDPSDPIISFPCGDGVTPNSVWFSYTATNDNSIVAKTLGSDYDTVLSVWTGSPGSFSRVACNDDDFSGGFPPSFQSNIAFAGSTGTTYHIMVSSFDGIGGNLSFNLSLQTPPANDNFSNSTVVSATPFAESISAIGASIEPSDPFFSDCDSPIDTPTLWYSYTPTVNETVTASTLGSNYDTVLSVWTGGPGSFVAVACNDDTGVVFQSEVIFSATAATTYHFQVASFFGDVGSLTFSVTVVP